MLKTRISYKHTVGYVCEVKQLWKNQMSILDQCIKWQQCNIAVYTVDMIQTIK